MDETKSRVKGYVLVFLAVTTWSFSEIFQKLLQGSVPAMSLSFLRFFFGFLPLLGIMAAQRDFKGVGGLIKRNWKPLVVASVVGFSLANFIYFSGIHRTQANVGSAIYTSYPIFISIYSIFLLNERDNLKLKFVGYAVGFAGILILITNFDFAGLVDVGNLVGNALVLLGAILFGFYSVLGKKIQNVERETVPNVQLKFTMVSQALACAGNLAFLLFIPAFQVELPTLFQYSGEAWIWILLLGTITTGLSMYVFFIGVKELEVSKGMSIAMSKPILTTFFAFLILEELPSFSLFISIPMVMLAVYLVTRPPRDDQKGEILAGETDGA